MLCFCLHPNAGLASCYGNGGRAERHYQAAIQTAKEIGAKGVLGQSYLDLGLLYKIKRRNDKAKNYISSAINMKAKGLVLILNINGKMRTDKKLMKEIARIN